MDGKTLRSGHGPLERAQGRRKAQGNNRHGPKRKRIGTFNGGTRDIRKGRILRYLSSARWARLVASGFPPLAGSKWVTGSEERLIKLVTNGLMGPLEVNGKTYPGQVPMTPFGNLLNDEETAAVLTYVRNSFGNKASPIPTEKVKEVQGQIKDKMGFYSPEELLKEHPLD